MHFSFDEECACVYIYTQKMCVCVSMHMYRGEDIMFHVYDNRVCIQITRVCCIHAYKYTAPEPQSVKIIMFV